MSDEVRTSAEERHQSHGLLLGIGVAGLALALGALGWSYSIQHQMGDALTQAQQRNDKLQSQLDETNAHMKATNETLAQSVGMTQKQLETRAQTIMQTEQAQHAQTAKLEKEQAETSKQVNAVSSDVSNVKTDVGGVKTDVAKTQSDLATAVAQLTSMKGDLDGHSTLIARNRDELEVLKHKGDRSYYEFTLVKGQKKPVGTVSLELKKADSKKSRFTLVVYSDDKEYEKRDKNLNEPLQFYSGKDPMLYEIVVNTVSAKNTITGYLSTPKSAPVPATGQ
jgi:DNA anti-recombination protein RmuC